MKDVVGYEEYFSITEDGKLWSKRSNRFVKITVLPSGYCTHATKIGGRNGTNKLFKIHRCVAEAYLPNPDNLPVINHKDGNKLNNDVSNLEWCTHSHNTQHAYDNGLLISKKGSKAKNATLTDEQVKEIRERYIPYVVSIRDLVKMYNSSYSIIQGVVSRTRYI